jgi:hypothetical protein
MVKLEGVDGAWKRVTTAEAYRALVLKMLASRGISEKAQSQPLAAHINCGRWVTPCECGGGIWSQPGWAFAACVDCGRSWESVLFPSHDDLVAFDAVLSLRPSTGVGRRWYSWIPGQTVEDIERENLRHGWALPPTPVRVEN